jgi:mono/diheme cytochrome c family protein
MKLRHILLFTLITLLATACNFTLAEDVTPPPGYIAPTPLPTLVLVPQQVPNVETGRIIYAEKCAACHGETGMGDGEQGIQLGVTVPAFGLPEIANPATMAEWYTVVTRGRMDRLMPPFASLNDQERWDVVAYAMSLHTTEEQISKGQEIFEANCTGCSTDFFKDQSRMSAISAVDLARIVKQGNDVIPPFGTDLSDDDMWAVAAYLRSLSFDTAPAVVEAPASTATPEAASVTEAPVATDAGTPSAEITPAATEETAMVIEPTVVFADGFGTVSGTIDNQTGIDLPSDQKVTLRAFDHGTDPSAGPQEVAAIEGTVNADGSYSFTNVEMPDRRIFIAEVEVEGIQVQSDFVIVEAGTSSITLPPLVLHAMTEDTSLLVVDEVRMFVEYTDTEIQVFSVYSFRNPTDKTIVVELKDGGDIPFIKTPEGTINGGYEALQDSEPFVNTDKGLAIPPSDGSYGLLGYSTTPIQDEFEIGQEFALPATSYAVFLPEGVTAEGERLTSQGMQALQGFNFETYVVANVPAGEIVKFTISGTPKETSEETTDPAVNNNQNLLIGAGAIGIALIIAGAWLYLRDRRSVEETDEDGEEDEEQEFDSSEDVLDAIVALDDLHRAKKITDEAYQKRRAELKDILKGMM